MTKYAKEPFAFGNKDGSNTVILTDEAFNDNDPIVKAWPDRFFTPVERPLPPK